MPSTTPATPTADVSSSPRASRARDHRPRPRGAPLRPAVQGPDRRRPRDPPQHSGVAPALAGRVAGHAGHAHRRGPAAAGHAGLRRGAVRASPGRWQPGAGPHRRSPPAQPAAAVDRGDDAVARCHLRRRGRGGGVRARRVPGQALQPRRSGRPADARLRAQGVVAAHPRRHRGRPRRRGPGPVPGPVPVARAPLDFGGALRCRTGDQAGPVAAGHHDVRGGAGRQGGALGPPGLGAGAGRRPPAGRGPVDLARPAGHRAQLRGCVRHPGQDLRRAGGTIRRR